MNEVTYYIDGQVVNVKTNGLPFRYGGTTLGDSGALVMSLDSFRAAQRENPSLKFVRVEKPF